jgi:hypothetical protein
VGAGRTAERGPRAWARADPVSAGLGAGRHVRPGRSTRLRRARSPVAGPRDRPGLRLRESRPVPAVPARARAGWDGGRRAVRRGAEPRWATGTGTRRPRTAPNRPAFCMSSWPACALRGAQPPRSRPSDGAPTPGVRDSRSLNPPGQAESPLARGRARGAWSARGADGDPAPSNPLAADDATACATLSWRRPVPSPQPPIALRMRVSGGGAPPARGRDSRSPNSARTGGTASGERARRRRGERPWAGRRAVARSHPARATGRQRPACATLAASVRSARRNRHWREGAPGARGAHVGRMATRRYRIRCWLPTLLP